MNIHENFMNFLRSEGIDYESIEHPPVSSCEESAIHRDHFGWNGIGSKCVLFHAKDKYYFVVTSAFKKLSSDQFFNSFGTDDVRYSTREEQNQQIGCGSCFIPPFGISSNDIPYFIDEDLLKEDFVMFNPDDPSKSIRMRTRDLENIYKNTPNQVFKYCSKDNGELVVRELSKN